MRKVITETEEFREGRQLFNDGRYFDAHESWEHLWRDRSLDEQERRFLQGLIMAAGAFYHYQNRQCTGSTVLLGKSRELIGAARETHPEIGVEEFLRELDRIEGDFRECSFAVSNDRLPRIPSVRPSC